MRETENEYQLAPDLSICRILNGMWQVAGAHGHIDPASAIDSMMSYHDAGFRTWDLADIYGPAEDFVGEFRHRLSHMHGQPALNDVRALTKWVPFPGTTITKSIVKQNIDKSCRRMGVEALDLLQFHWWDYVDSNYLDALGYLSELREEGEIRHLGLTNFDTERLKIMIDHGLRLVSNQVQYSLVDRRPQVRMAQFCKKHDIGLLTYGTICGGLLSERYLARPEPSSVELNTASLQKYKQMIDAWGGWNLFQELLHTLKEIADKHKVSIANVATRYVLDQPAVAGVIIGARLGITDHKADNVRVFDMNLDGGDYEKIDAINSKSQDLFALIGDCGSEYRT